MMDDDLRFMPVTYRGVSLPHAELVEFDPATGYGKFRLTPGGPVIDFQGGTFDAPPPPNDPDVVLAELMIELKEVGF